MKRLLTSIDAVGEILCPIFSDEAFSAFKKQQNEIRTILLEHEYIRVPIVGIYSTGKTTLINSLLGEEGKLPVGRDPITAIPCEILPVKEGEIPHVEVIHEGEVVFNGAIEKYNEVITTPGDYALCYCCADTIKQWYDNGIILVDMPGADSGVKQHNDALLQYIKKGTVYAFLQDPVDGAISKTGLEFIDEILRYGLESYVFVSRIDLVKSEEGLNSTIDKIKTQIEDKNNVFYAGVISAKNGNIDSFYTFINNLDARAKGQKLMTPIVEGFIDSQIRILRNMGTVIGDSNLAALEAQINDLENRISEIKNGLEDALKTADTPEKSTDDILDRIENAIRQNASEVAQAFLEAKRGNRINAVSQTLTDILRPELVAAFSDEQQQYIDALQADIDALTRRLIDNTNINEGVIATVINTQSEGIVVGIKLMAEKLINSENPVIAVIGQALAFVAEYVPDLLRNVFGRSDDKIKDDLKKQVRTVVCANLRRELRPAILFQVKEMQKYVLEATRKQYEARLEQLYAQLNSLREAVAKGKDAVDGKRLAYAAAVAELEKIKDDVSEKNSCHV